jgi:hypothetical protein
MIPTAAWRQLSDSDFERLALEHVRDLYPEIDWRSTPPTSDGGKDAIGQLKDAREGVIEIYWMEAKHHPANRSIGKYTLDTHLISAFQSYEVKRLHVVTSGLLSANFLVRADTFSRQHGFVFAYSDQEALEAWLATHVDFVRKYFSVAAEEVVSTLRSYATRIPAIFCRASVTADTDGANPLAISVPHLLPGKKFRLVLTTSVATRPPAAALPFRLVWELPKRVSLLTPQDDHLCLRRFDPIKEPVVSVPFRLLWFSSTKLPNPGLSQANSSDITAVALKDLCELPRLFAPFVGHGARQELSRLKRLLREEVSFGQSRLVLVRAPAGAGKTRLLEEVRDDAQALGFVVRLVQMTSTVRAQEEHWRLFFRWLFGIEHNPFALPEEEVLRKRLARLDLALEEVGKFHASLNRFLQHGICSDELFNVETALGRHMTDAVRAVVGQRIDSRLLLHIDDAHHLSRRESRPLHFLRHLIETSDSLPLCLVIAGRNDETVRETSFASFARSLDIGGCERFQVIDLPALTRPDAEELVITTLRWPELRVLESRTLAKIITRAGTNPFFLMQTLDHLAMDYETVAFGHDDENRFLIDIPAFKRALNDVPRTAAGILSERFAGLRRRGDERLLLAMAAIAVIGRRAPRIIVSKALKRPLTKRDTGRLLELGYLPDASDGHLELEHDLLVDALRTRPEAQRAALSLARLLRDRPPRSITPEQQAAVYFAAGPRHRKAAWDLTRQIAEERFERQEYQSIFPLLGRLECISAASHAPSFDLGLTWLSAIVQQHCGNTQAALNKFESIRQSTSSHLAKNAERYVDATIEVSNQYLLRASPSLAIETLSEALAALEEPALHLLSNVRLRLTALAHNRFGAALHLMDCRPKAIEHFNASLAASEKVGDDYLYAHTHWNLAALLRFHAPATAIRHLRRAREIKDRCLRHKERFRLMVETSEIYSHCLRDNRAIVRFLLRAIAAEASEKGYLFQMCDALLSLASAALTAQSWDEAQNAALTTLDVTVASEDLRNRAIATHYLSVTAHMLGAQSASRDWCSQSTRFFVDAALSKSRLGRCIRYNAKAVDGAYSSSPRSCGLQAGLLLWHPFDRV